MQENKRGHPFQGGPKYQTARRLLGSSWVVHDADGIACLELVCEVDLHGLARAWDGELEVLACALDLELAVDVHVALALGQVEACAPGAC